MACSVPTVRVAMRDDPSVLVSASLRLCARSSFAQSRRAAEVGCAALILGSLGCGAGTAPPVEAGLPPVDVAAAVEAELDRLVADGATRAAIVVLDPSDGRVLAASGRGPDGAGEADRVVAMGSTFKPLTIAAALDAGLDPARRFDGEGGEWRVDAQTVLRDAHPRESFDAEGALVASSNVGTAKIVEAVGAAPIARYFETLGVEVPAGASWLAIGAGIGPRTSLRRLAAAYAVFGNGGRLVEPTADGTGASQDVLRPETARTMLALLEAAVGDDGTGRRARVAGHRVAGKTGTTEGAAVFAGLAPADAPRFVIAVRAEPAGDGGGAIAAPSFARVAAALLP